LLGIPDLELGLFAFDFGNDLLFAGVELRGFEIEAGFRRPR
jgi:hypothetical protein